MLHVFQGVTGVAWTGSILQPGDIYIGAGLSRPKLVPRDFVQSVNCAFPLLAALRDNTSFLCSTSSLEGRRERTLESPEGFNYMFSGVRCNLMTLQRDRFQLSECFFRLYLCGVKTFISLRGSLFDLFISRPVLISFIAL